MTKLPEGMPRRIASLPVNPAGYPIPWFVDQRSNPASPDFRVAEADKWNRAVLDRRCWVCGQRITGPTETFVIGPMCAVNRTTAEPPCHRDCATWSAAACPFLANPHRTRREAGKPDGAAVAGVSIDRNPGVVLLWSVRKGGWGLFNASNGTLIQLGNPTSVQWIAEGRPATRAEILASIESGLPVLASMAMQDGSEAVAELNRRTSIAMELVPA